MAADRTPLAMLFDAFTDTRRELARQLEETFAGESTTVATETLVLAELHGKGDMSPSALAAATGLSRGRVSHLLDSLQTKGLIARVQDERDRRRFIVTLTADGRLAAHRSAERVQAVHELGAEVLGDDGIDRLYSQLRRLERASVERRRESPPAAQFPPGAGRL